MATDTADLKRIVKDLQSTPPANHEAILDILKNLKKTVKATEVLLRDTKAGLAVGKLRQHEFKDISDLAKELVKKWKTEVDEEKKRAKSAEVPAANAAARSAPAKAAASTTRTFKSDAPKFTPSGDVTRDKCIQLIYDALAGDSGAPSDLLLKRSSEIENTVYTEFNRSVTSDYRNKMRRLFLNLKDKGNPALRESVVSGDVPAARLCSMSNEEMASEERKQADKTLHERNLHKSLGAGEQQAETDAFQCGRCKQRKTVYRQAQTRSADEPMTTFVTCVNCNNRWKFS